MRFDPTNPLLTTFYTLTEDELVEQAIQSEVASGSHDWTNEHTFTVAKAKDGNPPHLSMRCQCRRLRDRTTMV